MSTKNRTRRTTTRNIRFPNQMIEQINIALSGKRGPGISQPGSLKPAVGATSKREHIHQCVMKNEHPRVLPEQDDIVNSLNYEGIAVVGAAVSPLSDSDRLRVGSV